MRYTIEYIVVESVWVEHNFEQARARACAQRVRLAQKRQKMETKRSKKATINSYVVVYQWLKISVHNRKKKPVCIILYIRTCTCTLWLVFCFFFFFRVEISCNLFSLCSLSHCLYMFLLYVRCARIFAVALTAVAAAVNIVFFFHSTSFTSFGSSFSLSLSIFLSFFHSTVIWVFINLGA